MNCKQCGAPMQLFRERDYYHCDFCDSYHFPEPNPDGIRILGENPDSLECPLCKITLNMAVIDNYYRGYHCSNCRGLMFNRTTFRETIDNRRSKTKAPPEPINTFNQAELNREVYCPVCKKQMGTYQYMGPGNIVIDTCHEDDLIWLDFGELNKVVNAPGRDRGVPRKKPKKEEGEKEQGNKKKGSVFEQALYDMLESFFS